MYSGLFLLRLAVGMVFIFHSVPKLRDTEKTAQSMGWSYGQVMGLGIIEFMSGIGLISGVATKASAFALALVMIGAIYHKIQKWHVPFSSSNSTGWEFDLVLLASSLTIYLK